MRTFFEYFFMAGGLFLLIGALPYLIFYVFVRIFYPASGSMVLGGYIGGALGCAFMCGVLAIMYGWGS